MKNRASKGREQLFTLWNKIESVNENSNGCGDDKKYVTSKGTFEPILGKSYSNIHLSIKSFTNKACNESISLWSMTWKETICKSFTSLWLCCLCIDKFSTSVSPNNSFLESSSDETPPRQYTHHVNYLLWETVDLPNGKDAINLKWVFKTKFAANRNIQSIKLVLWWNGTHNKVWILKKPSLQ